MCIPVHCAQCSACSSKFTGRVFIFFLFYILQYVENISLGYFHHYVRQRGKEVAIVDQQFHSVGIQNGGSFGDQ